VPGCQLPQLCHPMNNGRSRFARAVASAMAVANREYYIAEPVDRWFWTASTAFWAVICGITVRSLTPTNRPIPLIATVPQPDLVNVLVPLTIVLVLSAGSAARLWFRRIRSARDGWQKVRWMLAGVTLVIAAGVMLRPEPPRVTIKNFQRLTEYGLHGVSSMNWFEIRRDKVEAVLGPPGDYRTRPTVFYPPHGPFRGDPDTRSLPNA
jgi:hypothetical protein